MSHDSTWGAFVDELDKVGAAKSMAQQRFFGAELRRAREGKETETGLSEKKLKAFPVCGAKRVMTCRCWRGDSKCASGHEWHYEKGGRIVLGNSHTKQAGDEGSYGRTYPMDALVATSGRGVIVPQGRLGRLMKPRIPGGLGAK